MDSFYLDIVDLRLSCAIYLIKNLSHNNHCFQCNIAIKNFLVSHTCDVIGQCTVHMYFYAKILKHG